MGSVKISLATGFLALLVGPVFGAPSAIELFQTGRRAQEERVYYLAAQKYKESLQANPSYLPPMIGLAECFFLMEEYDEALRWIVMAEKFGRDDNALLVLEGRIRIGQGDLAGARGLFQGVLARAPNDLEARFGMAEVEVAAGRTREALSQYTQALKLAPESKKGILSLALLSEGMGDQAAAAKYYDLALRSFAEDPEVELAAGTWYANNGDYTAAEKRAQIALSLDASSQAAMLLLGNVHLEMELAQDAVRDFQGIISVNRENSLAWYGLGLAYSKSGDAVKAISSFSSGLAARPDDEVARIAEESVALDSLKMEDAQRVALAAFHRDLGALLESRNFIEKAQAEYRRALLIDPTSLDARLSYAKSFRTQGFPAKYINELQVLEKLGIKDTFVSDALEAAASRLTDTVSARWGVDQFALDRRKFSIPVFTMDSANRLLHPLAGSLLARYFGETLMRFESVVVPSISSQVSTMDEAFRISREREYSYFLLLTTDETERGFSTMADLHLGRTGARVASFSDNRTGNDRIRDSYLKIGDLIASSLPPRGTLLKRKFDRGLIDIGSLQGVKKGDTLVVVKRSKVREDPETPGITYDDADVVGTFSVQAVDEGISEGLLAGKGYFDLINTGDEVVYVPQKKTPAPPPAQPRTGNILTRLFGIGG
jgi:tetratricopeptide (TPR) repeat protein